MNNLVNLIREFPHRRVMVLGDIMLDEYLEGTVDRISPEAPIQIVLEKSREYKLGGAGNVASNISSLGANISIFSFVGEDLESKILEELLKEKNINYFLETSGTTIKKSRVIGNGQQLLRIDKEDISEKKFSEEMKTAILKEADNSDIIIVSDYAKGTITQPLMDFLKDYHQKMVANPKPVNKTFYGGLRLMIINEKEAREMSGLKDIYESGRKLRQELNSPFLITQGEKGMTLFSEEIIDIPTNAREVYDVQGAGDTVISTVALAISVGASLEEAAIMGNYAAGIAVGKKGTYSVGLKELQKKISGLGKKIVELEELQEIIDNSRKNNKSIVWTNGCFDLFHLGHKYSLERAKEQGDVLIVGLDSDESVKALKGPTRPIYSQTERAELLSSIEFVDFVTIFPVGAVIDYLRKLKPDVYVKSGDYTLDTINQEERKLVESYGGRIFLPKGIQNLSTTRIVEKIRGLK